MDGPNSPSSLLPRRPSRRVGRTPLFDAKGPTRKCVPERDVGKHANSGRSCGEECSSSRKVNSARMSRETQGRSHGPSSISARDLAEQGWSSRLAAALSALDLEACALCVCDVNSDDQVTAVDALVVLRLAVGLAADLNCRICS